MAYVQISDPVIIDLAAWHQIINVVNQHSDSIAALSNNFGMAWSPIPDGDNWSSPFDFGSSMIQFGRIKIATLASPPDLNYFELVDFPNNFSSKPVVVATIYSAHAGNQDGIVSIKEITNNNFVINVQNLTNNGALVNWIAIGPK